MRSVAADDYRLEIRQRQYILGKGAERILRRIENAYRKAPHFRATFPLIQEIMTNSETNVAAFNMRLLRSIADRLKIRKRFLLASDLPPSGLTGQARVIDLCKTLGATRYVNPIGGRELYDAATFQAHGVSLGFLETMIAPREGSHPFLSIVHTLMTESDEAIADLLTRYRIVPG